MFTWYETRYLPEDSYEVIKIKEARRNANYYYSKYREMERYINILNSQIKSCENAVSSIHKYKMVSDRDYLNYAWIKTFNSMVDEIKSLPRLLIADRNRYLALRTRVYNEAKKYQIAGLG